MQAQLEQVHQQLREQERDIEQRVLVVKEALQRVKNGIGNDGMESQ
jgi:hypothetical protein